MNQLQKDWEEIDHKLYKKFTFKDFKQAMAWMQTVGIHCEKVQHHPEWKNIYNKVEVWLNTHDEGDIVTKKDIELSLKMDEIFQDQTQEKI